MQQSHEILYNELKSDINRRDGEIISSYEAIKNAIRISKRLTVYSPNEEHLFLSTYLLYLKKWMIEIEIGGEFDTMDEAKIYLTNLKKMQIDSNHRFSFMTQLIILYLSNDVVSVEEMKALEGRVNIWYSDNTNIAEVHDIYLYLSMIAHNNDSLMLSRYYLLNAYNIAVAINSDNKIRDYILTKIAENFYITGDIEKFLSILDKNTKIAVSLYRSI